MLIQFGNSVAFRHPEYMLATDLVCLYQLHADSERLLWGVDWKHPPAWAGGLSEHSQGLARITVLTCFNLVETFLSGLARAHSMSHPHLDDSLREKLLSTREPLRKRMKSVPRLILGSEPALDLDAPPFSVLLGKIKTYRDSFVHCEPGHQPSERGYVKQVLFHDVSRELVLEAVASSEGVIRNIWRLVHGKEGPSWLPSRDPNGRYGSQAITLAPFQDPSSERVG